MGNWIFSELSFMAHPMLHHTKHQGEQFFYNSSLKSCTSILFMEIMDRKFHNIVMYVVFEHYCHIHVWQETLKSNKHRNHNNKKHNLKLNFFLIILNFKKFNQEIVFWFICIYTKLSNDQLFNLYIMNLIKREYNSRILQMRKTFSIYHS